jgi:hypothetical protein
VLDLVRSYLAQIRSLLRERPDLRPYLKRCRHCRILFFTDPRNAGRSDLYCGFGCRDAHRRESNTRRSAAFYREHPDKKRYQNRKRYLRTAPPCPDSLAEPKDELPAPIVRHVRVIVSLIEGRPVTVDEIVKMLAKKGRQHRIARSRQRTYGVRRIRDRGS